MRRRRFLVATLLAILLALLIGFATLEPDGSAAASAEAVIPEQALLELPAPRRHTQSDWTGPLGTDRSLLQRRGATYPKVRFMTASDLHHLSSTLWNDGSAFARFWTTNDGKPLRDGKLLLDALVATVIEESPEFLVVTGDLTTNGAVASHTEVAAAFRRIEDAGVPVYAIPGNHDISNPWASSFLDSVEARVDTVDPQDFRRLYRRFGYDDAFATHSGDLSYVVEPKPGLRLLMLDTNLYSRNEELGYPQTPGAFSPDQRRWILSVLEAAAAEERAVLAFSHHSFISHGVEGGYQDLSRIIDQWPRNTREFWDRAAPVMFTGHVHAQNITGLRGVEGEWIYDIVTGAFSIYPHSYRLLRITEQQRLQVEGKQLTPAALGSDGAETLRRFKEIYLRRTIAALAPRISKEHRLSAEESSAFAVYPALLSLNHMAGEEQPASESEYLAGLESRWREVAPEDLRRFLRYTTRDPAPRDNDIEIDLLTGRWRSLRVGDR